MYVNRFFCVSPPSFYASLSSTAHWIVLLCPLIRWSAGDRIRLSRSSLHKSSAPSANALERNRQSSLRQKSVTVGVNKDLSPSWPWKPIFQALGGLWCRRAGEPGRGVRFNGGLMLKQCTILCTSSFISMLVVSTSGKEVRNKSPGCQSNLSYIDLLFIRLVIYTRVPIRAL